MDDDLDKKVDQILAMFEKKEIADGSAIPIAGKLASPEKGRNNNASFLHPQGANTLQESAKYQTEPTEKTPENQQILHDHKDNQDNPNDNLYFSGSHKPGLPIVNDIDAQLNHENTNPSVFAHNNTLPLKETIQVLKNSIPEKSWTKPAVASPNITHTNILAQEAKINQSIPDPLPSYVTQTSLLANQNVLSALVITNVITLITTIIFGLKATSASVNNPVLDQLNKQQPTLLNQQQDQAQQKNMMSQQQLPPDYNPQRVLSDTHTNPEEPGDFHLQDDQKQAVRPEEPDFPEQPPSISKPSSSLATEGEANAQPASTDNNQPIRLRPNDWESLKPTVTPQASQNDSDDQNKDSNQPTPTSQPTPTGGATPTPEVI